MRACVVARVIDTMYQLIYSSAQTRLPPELALLTAPIFANISIRKFDSPRPP
jgi:hypothetical protein